MTQVTNGQRAVAAIASACIVCAPLTASFEGLRTHPYRDPAPRHTETVCYGETNIPMRVYTPDECGRILRDDLSKKYAPIILRCVPGFVDHKYPFAASIDAALNMGPGRTSDHRRGFCGSPVAVKFRAGEWPGGCRSFVGLHELPGTAAYPGLHRRRIAEMNLCLKN